MNQNASTDSSISSSFGAPAEDIARRAYELWEAEGRPEGSDLRHWLQAEQELSARKTGSAGRDGSNETAQPARSNPTTASAPRNSAGDARPPLGTRAGALPQRDAGRDGARDAKRSTNIPFGGDRGGAGNGQNAAKRKPANAPVL
jgi:hypothetical protein